MFDLAAIRTAEGKFVCNILPHKKFKSIPATLHDGSTHYEAPKSTWWPRGKSRGETVFGVPLEDAASPLGPE
jgi:hypothetical protein